VFFRLNEHVRFGTGGLIVCWHIGFVTRSRRQLAEAASLNAGEPGIVFGSVAVGKPSDW
jgi:hypothetical protein